MAGGLSLSSMRRDPYGEGLSESEQNGRTSSHRWHVRAEECESSFTTRMARQGCRNINKVRKVSLWRWLGKGHDSQGRVKKIAVQVLRLAKVSEPEGREENICPKGVMGVMSNWEHSGVLIKKAGGNPAQKRESGRKPE